ncbi:helix-turn-helix transcriptional regulator [Pantoea sp. B65]|uniref:helix-turn-helix transcriptional regulator n=1 Tax=Pantoea sp. B65 TaxID=2813359 RepID=UPI0039B3A05E
MSRAQRLLNLIQILRGHRFPVTGAQLAAQLNISLRTLYRDIGTLQEQGASIEGEAGLGYVLRPGFMLPPLMFSGEEIEALALGSRWVAARGDQRLSAAAKSALTKIAVVLPDDLRRSLDASTLLVGPPGSHGGEETLPQIRQAIRAGRKLDIHYLDLNGTDTQRIIWPFALGYFDHVRVLVAWCELRQGFRHFRTDRISALAMLEQRYPRRRQLLLKEWRESEGIAAQ